MNSEEFKPVCDNVWRGDAAILTGRGKLRSEAAFVWVVRFGAEMRAKLIAQQENHEQQ